MEQRFGGRQLRQRVEDQRLTTGKGRYTGNRISPDQLHLAVLRSPHAHADIKSVDLGAAKAMPGVVAVASGADIAADGVGPLGYPPMFKRPGGEPMTSPPRTLLAVETARFVGEPVVAVVAKTKAQALDALEAVNVDYDVLPAVTDVRDAVEPGAPVVWKDAPDNISCEARYGDAAAVEDAFKRAAHRVSIEVVNQRLVANPMERRTSIAAFDTKDGKLTFYCGSQLPTPWQMELSHIVGLPPEKVRVFVGDIGGGFGMRGLLHVEDGLAAYFAKKLGATVRWEAERSEDFLASSHGRDSVSVAELALDDGGRILAMRVKMLAAMGACLSGSTALVPLFLTPKVTPSIYAIPAIDITIQGILTNTMTTSAYRGAGRPEAIYLIERVMDEAARRLKISPLEIRRRNFIPRDAMPFTTIVGEVYDSGDFTHFLDRAAKEADWDGFERRREEAKKRGRLLGRGVSSYIEWTGGAVHTESVDVIVTGDGKVILHSATQAMGQGLETTYTQLIAERLGIDPKTITVIQGDTDVVHGFGSVGSRSAFVGGSAVAAGTESLIDTAKPLAADALEAAASDIVFGSGRFSIEGTDRSIGLFDLAQRQPEHRIAVTTSHTVGGPSWPNGTHVCEVEVDPDTGESWIRRYTTVDDVGTALNTMLVEGQIHGGIAQSIGQAMFEHCKYDRDSGQLLTGSYMDYGMPRADVVPSFTVNIDQSVPCQTNLLGAKGCGESGTVAAPPAIINAFVDALSPLGVKTIDMPA
ncbi:MAG TPA: xanthine dehydrogenase family protein molybdopterin-binding subunit, partial [Hyphomicrobiales bacterium]|nr:xanthine dehydrogenase family protein molybdopterin-binding subunit [Hyphomicrobiales bacterium]